MLPKATEVLIVGAGPTGMALAAALAQAGIEFVIVDKLAQGQNTSRAAVIHAHTLEMLDEIGVSDALLREGLKLTRFGIHDRDRRLIQIPFDRLPTRHPYLLMLPQDVTERILAERLEKLGHVVHRGYQVESVVQHAEEAVATVCSPSGQHHLAAKYIIGADGMHSVVRAAAGIDFTGETYGESFVLADVALSWGHGDDEVKLFFSPAGLVVVAPLPNGTFRVVATVADAPEHPEVSDIQALLDERGPEHGAARVERIVWSSRFRVHHRLADAYRKDRLFLIGDAAHVHSPAGGQGMNTGLVDALVLARMLADVLKGRRSADSLDAYESLRRPAAAQVLALAGRLTRAATMHGRLRRVMRNAVLSLMGRVTGVTRRMGMDLSGLSRRSAVLGPNDEQ